MFHSLANRQSACKKVCLSRLGGGAMLLVLMCATMASAQIGGIDSDPSNPGTGGKNIIQGSIYYDNGRRLDHRAKVRLRGLNSDLFVLSDDTGAFSFQR